MNGNRNATPDGDGVEMSRRDKWSSGFVVLVGWKPPRHYFIRHGERREMWYLIVELIVEVRKLQLQLCRLDMGMNNGDDRQAVYRPREFGRMGWGRI